MKLAGWILRWVSPDYGGATSMAVLRGLALRQGSSEGEVKRTVRELISAKQLRMISEKRHALYGLPKQRKARA